MPRTPHALKWLIDKRARVAGEIVKIQRMLEKCQKIADELSYLQDMIQSIDKTMALHEISVDVDLIPPIKSQNHRCKVAYGKVTASVLRCLRASKGIPLSVRDIVLTQRNLLNLRR